MSGEIVSIAEADQMQPGHTQYACGFYGVMMMRSMARVGSAPTLTPAQIIAQAEAYYALYNGTDSASNTAGMTNEQEYEMLHAVGLHYQETTLDMAVVKQWLAVGYPVLVAIVEASVRDMALSGANPYPWKASGNHIICITGVDAHGNVLVRDSANCTDLYNPNSLRPGPRTYDASALQLVSATVVVPPWLPRPVSGIPPAIAPVVSLWASAAQQQAAQNQWNSTSHFFGGTPPYDTGIARAWQEEYRAGRFHGPPLTAEFADVTWDGKAVRGQVFVGASCTWDGTAHWYRFG